MSRQVNSINLSKRSCEVEESLLLMLFPCIHIAEFNFITGRRKIWKSALVQGVEKVCA